MTYNLDEAAVRRLTAAALDAHPAGGGRFLALAIGPHVPLADVARTVLAAGKTIVPVAAGSDEAADQRDAVAYRRHEDDSLFFLVLDRQAGMPAGAGRVITGGGRTLDEAPEHLGVDLSVIVSLHEMYDGRIWDLAAVTVLPGYRGPILAAHVESLLYRTLCNAGRRAGVRHVVALLDQHAFRGMSLIGVPFQPMAAITPDSSATVRGLYVNFAELQLAIARQAERLRNLSSPFAGEIRARGLRRLLLRRLAARAAEQVATGKGLDDNILLPGLERRRALIRQL